jgi:transposase
MRDSFVGQKALALWDAPGYRGNQQLWGRARPLYLKAAGVSVVEVERPKRRHLRPKGKSDPIDAEAAARGRGKGRRGARRAKGGDGKVEMIRTSRDRPTRVGAVKATTQAAKQLSRLFC